MIRLIVNSDDYGRGARVSKGIREAHLGGIVSSTTCMMNLPNTVDDIQIAMKETPRLGLGVHLVLTAGRPLSPPEKVKSLTDMVGVFPRLKGFIDNIERLDSAEAKAEWKLQIEKFIQTTGRKPTHLDSHHHSSYHTEDLFLGMLELAKDYDCPIRLPRAIYKDWSRLPGETIENTREYSKRMLNEFGTRTPDNFFASFYDDLATREELIRILNEMEEGTHELMCHPGYTDSELEESTIYAAQRQVELGVLTDPEVRETLEARSIQLITFDEL